MKKFLVSIIVFIFFVGGGGGTAFFFGWVEYRLEQGESALLFSKTSGWDDAIFTSGKQISWRWQLLIPKNVTLYPLTTSERSTTTSFSFELPSGSLYSHYLEGAASFLTKGTIRLSYRLEPGSFHKQVRETQIPPEKDFFEEWDRKLKDEINNQISARIAEGMQDRESLQEALTQDMKQIFPQISYLRVNISSLNFPDVELYTHAKENYLQRSLIQQAQLLNIAQNTAESRQQYEEKIRRMEEVSRVFTSNAAILDYLKITGGEDPLQILE